MSDYFRDARHIKIGDRANFGHVGRDQHIYNTTQIVRKAKRKRTEFDDVHQVKSSAIYRLRNIHVDTYENRCKEFERRYWKPDPGRNVDRTICVAQVDREGRVGTLCTTVSYTGPDAREAFVEEYREKLKLAMTTTGAQVYAIDIGSVPSMIYWNELVPAAVFTGNLGKLGKIYLYNLRVQWDCSLDELWMDDSRGVICRGPKGPWPRILWLDLKVENLPSTVDLLQEDVLMRFLATRKSKRVDHTFVCVIPGNYVTNDAPEIECDRLTVFSTLTQTPIAVANNIWESPYKNLSERTLLENGMTRFHLDGRQTRLSLELNWYTEHCWLSQASSVFHALGIEGNFDDFKLVYRMAGLSGELFEDQADQRVKHPIFLFIHPPPLNLPNGDTSSLHFWSFDKDGQNPLSPDICDEFGLPNELELDDKGYESHSWPTNTYKRLHEYQRLRGFDPTTTEFARQVANDGNIFQPLHDVTRFEEISEQQTSWHPPPGETDLPIRAGLNGESSNALHTQTRGDHEYYSIDSPPAVYDFGNKRQKTGVSTETRSDGREQVELDWSPCRQDIAGFSGAMNYPMAQQTSMRPVRPLPRRCTPTQSLTGMTTNPFPRTPTSPYSAHLAGGFPPSQPTYSMHSIPSTLSSTYLPTTSFHVGTSTHLFPVNTQPIPPPSTYEMGSYTYPPSYPMWNESGGSLWPPQPIPSALYGSGSAHEGTLYGGTVATSHEAGGWAQSAMSYPDSQPGIGLETQPFYYSLASTTLYEPSTVAVRTEGRMNDQTSFHQGPERQMEH